MNLIRLSQDALARHAANSPKVASLFCIAAGVWIVVDWAGVNDLSSPWLALPLLPLALLYLAERLGKLRWFSGMTLPTLCVMAGSIALVWVLNIKPSLPSAIEYAVVGGLIAALAFLMFRMWTFHPVERQVCSAPSMSSKQT